MSSLLFTCPQTNEHPQTRPKAQYAFLGPFSLQLLSRKLLLVLIFSKLFSNNFENKNKNPSTKPALRKLFFNFILKSKFLKIKDQKSYQTQPKNLIIFFSTFSCDFNKILNMLTNKMILYMCVYMIHQLQQRENVIDMNIRLEEESQFMITKHVTKDVLNIMI